MPTIVPSLYRAPVAVAGQPPSVAAPAVPIRPTAVVVTQGPQGPAARGFGTVDYSDLDAGAPLVLPAGQWVRLTRATAPSKANLNLPSGPWANFTFWDGSLFHARALGDVYLVKFAFTVIPMERGSGFAFSIRPADDAIFEFGPEPIVLSVDAGQMQTGSETFFEQVRSRFAASGATLYVMSTTGATLLQFSPEIVPLAHA